MYEAGSLRKAGLPPERIRAVAGAFKSGENKKLFFDALPKRFTRKEAIELAKNFNIAERTVGNLLKNCLGNHLTQPEYGVYEKII